MITSFSLEADDLVHSTELAAMNTVIDALKAATRQANWQDVEDLTRLGDRLIKVLHECSHEYKNTVSTSLQGLRDNAIRAKQAAREGA